MKDRKLFETVAEAGQIFAVGFDMEDNDDGTQGAEIRSYVEFDGITTTDAMKVIGDVIGKLIRDATKNEKTRSAMLKTLIMHVVDSMNPDESETKQEPKAKGKSDNTDEDFQKLLDTLDSIKSLLEVINVVKED